MGTGADIGAAAAAVDVSWAARKFTTSDFETRPSRPAPASALESSLFSSATRLAAGLEFDARIGPRRGLRRP